MDCRPIGIFDSGFGGFTMARRLAALLPDEDIIYLGDTGRVPYGPRSRETIIKYASQDAAFLAGFGIKAMVVACNTVCSTAFGQLKNHYSIPLYDVVETPASAAANSTRNRKIGVIGTAATIRSNAYENAIHKISNDIVVHSVACPLFVPLVEEGLVQADFEAAILIAKYYLEPLLHRQVDTLILGCTHYSLLSGTIAQVMGKDVTLVDSGAVTAEFVASDLSKRGLLREAKTGETLREDRKIKYYVTDSTDGFALLASKLLDCDVRGMVEQITLE